MKRTTSIRIDPDVLHKARIAAVTERKTLGQWLEEAILAQIERRKGEQDVAAKDG